MFRSRSEASAERAEVEGRFDEAARLYVEAGARDEAFRVLVRAAESAETLSRRRDYLARAYAVARTDDARADAKKALARVTLAEYESRAPSSDEDRARLAEASTDLEKGGLHREAARGYKLLNDRDGTERCLVLAGDVDGYEREAGMSERQERLRLRRRTAVESFEGLWRSGDRLGALVAIDDWIRGNTEDQEARGLADERRDVLVNTGRFEARIDGALYAFVGVFPCALGREAAVSLRGAGVSREHCIVGRDGDALTIRDNGSRNGTKLRGFALTGTVPLEEGHELAVGSDLILRCERFGGALCLTVDRGMDRGRRVVFLTGSCELPVGVLRFDGGGRAVIAPKGAVKLSGQRVVAEISLARGDRLDGESGGTLEVLR